MCVCGGVLSALSCGQERQSQACITPWGQGLGLIEDPHQLPSFIVPFIVPLVQSNCSNSLAKHKFCMQKVLSSISGISKDG